MLTIFALFAASDWIDRLGAPDPAAREAAMREALEHPELEGLLQQRLPDASSEMRLRIEYVIRSWDDRQAWLRLKEEVRFHKHHGLLRVASWFQRIRADDPVRFERALKEALGIESAYRWVTMRDPWTLPRPELGTVRGVQAIGEYAFRELTDHPEWTSAWACFIESLEWYDLGLGASQMILSNLGDGDPAVRSHNLGLVSIRFPLSGPTIAPLLQDPVPSVRDSALGALQSLGEKAVAFVPQIEQRLTDSDESVRCAALHAIAAIDYRPSRIIALMQLGLRDDSAQCRSVAISTLDWAWPRPIGALPVLITALSDTDSSVRDEAALQIGQFGPDAGPAVPALIDAIRPWPGRPIDNATWRAVSALSEIGETAADAVPALRHLADVSDRGVEADRAIARIVQAAKPPLWAR